MTERVFARIALSVLVAIALGISGFGKEGNPDQRYMDSGCFLMSETSGCVVNGMSGVCDIDATYGRYGNWHLLPEEWIPLPLSVSATAWCYEFQILGCKETRTKSGSGTVLVSKGCYFTSLFGICADSSYSSCWEN